MEVMLSTSRDYSIVSIGGQIHSKHSYADGSLGYYRHEQTGGVSPLHSPADHAKIDAAIIELAHAEAMDVELFEHRIQVAGDLVRKHGEESAVEACHAEALEMNREFNRSHLVLSSYPYSVVWDIHSPLIKAQAIAIAHEEALAMDKAMGLSALGQQYSKVLTEYIWRDTPENGGEAIRKFFKMHKEIEHFFQLWDEAVMIDAALHERLH
ncbi:hypothetical protein A9X63_18610 [Klebsiella pneumoniae]|uniref:hypothetical protein n=1 Tax=Klebsiella pneumoniae TaxID=573 RepID=UPI000847DB0E|nr:hypothetical protein [Klebsiella pneumoniae]MCS6630621.1 hypothetical protein [Klebsiella pneumoniae subsp. pneumoniae]MEA4437509.1 hypothetical protein [Klebsiella pneumoniae]ODP88774.1 hypothetical protein A9X63_18610 [Klebsiella pneumoniae]